MSEEFDFKTAQQDINFLLSFVPSETPEEVPAGLPPMFYFSGNYQGDLEIAEKIKQIKEKYKINDVVLKEDNIDEDTENE